MIRSCERVMLVVMMMMTMTTGRTAANTESEARGREGGCRKGSGAPRRRDIALTLGKHRQCSGADRRRIQSTECTECYFGPRRIVRPAVGDESTCRIYAVHDAARLGASRRRRRKINQLAPVNGILLRMAERGGSER